jgi:hypothetical protein
MISARKIDVYGFGLGLRVGSEMPQVHLHQFAEMRRHSG